MGTQKFIPAQYLEPHYSTKFFRAYYHFLARHYNKTILKEICDETGMPLDYLLADGNWVSHTYLKLFLTKITEKTGNNRIAEEVGGSLFHPDNINPFEFALLKIMPPALFFFSLPFGAGKLNRYSKYKLLKFVPGFASYELVTSHDDKHGVEICQNAIGTFQATKDFYKFNHVRVAHTACIHQGAEKCTFEISYQAIRYWQKLVVTLVAFITSTSFVIDYLVNMPEEKVYERSLHVYFGATSFVLTAVLIFLLYKFSSIIRHNSLHYEQQKTKDTNLFEKQKKLDRRYQEFQLLKELSLNLVNLKSAKEVISFCLDDLSKRFGYQKSMAMMVASTGDSLYVEEVRGFGSEAEKIYSLKVLYPAQDNNPQLFANVLEKGAVAYIKDIEVFRQNLKPENQGLIKALGVSSIIVAPIQDQEKKYGLLIIGSVGGERMLTEEDKYLIENISRMLSLFFQNARNFENEQTLRTIFQKYVPAPVLEGIGLLKTKGVGFLAPKNNGITSMFIDLRGFTSLSETLSPESISNLLNLYVTFVTKEIAAQGGIIDNLVGDGVVAFFPAEEGDRTLHARKALNATLNILAKVDELETLSRQRGYGTIGIGIGLHSGSAIVGSMGSEHKLNYTAIGDTVNLASRLQDLSKKYRSETISSEYSIAVLSEEVFKRARLNVPFRDLGEVRVRGRTQLVRTFMIDRDMARAALKDGLPLEFDSKQFDALFAVQENSKRRKTDKSKKPA
jgi:adenylate cyclase